MTLTTKEKKALKSRGQKLADDARVGKEGLSDAMLAHIRAVLARNELAKVRFAEKLEGASRKSFAEELCAAIGAQCVAVVGRTVLVYKKKPEETA
ncbi:MAG: YhbY family RNA-binding protein [Phycisphaeraceae bacterium]|nr:YhbY family RNA-binding protein [Phycisphaeraceae bacterium]